MNFKNFNNLLRIIKLLFQSSLLLDSAPVDVEKKQFISFHGDT